MLPATTVAREPAPAAPSEPSRQTCVSCGRPSTTPYCPHCGERRASDRKYTLPAFLGEAFEALTNADSTITRTLRTLFSRPGELTAAYMQGVRVRYMKPLQLFFVLNVLYFLWASWIGGWRVFDTTLGNHVVHQWYGDIARDLVRGRLVDRDITFDAYAASFNGAATVQAKSLIVVMVPAFALLVGVLQVRRRRPLVQHLVYALHTYCMLLVFLVAAYYLVAMPVTLYLLARELPQSAFNADAMLGMVQLAALVAYIAASLRGAYGERLVTAVPKAVILALGIAVILFLYRGLLFFTTFSTT